MGRKASTMRTLSLYDDLQVKHDATDDEIKKAYRTLALKYHPDKNPDDPSVEEKIRVVNRAYLILKDPKKRKIYDQYGTNGLRMMSQLNDEYLDLLLLSQNKAFKCLVMSAFLMTCCCYGFFCYCFCCYNFCCGRYVPAEDFGAAPEESEEMDGQTSFKDTSSSGTKKTAEENIVLGMPPSSSSASAEQATGGNHSVRNQYLR